MVRPSGAATSAFWSSRLLVLFAAWLALTLWTVDLSGGRWSVFPSVEWLDGLVRFDAGWYWTIADRGYYYEPGTYCNVNFFPLYPLVVLPVSWPLRVFLSDSQAFYAAGVLVSLASFWIALVGLERLTRATLGELEARRAVWLAAMFPFSVYASAPYTEALFLALAVWAFYAAHRGRWGLACVLASLCAVTRIVGFLVAVGLFLEHLRQIGWSPRRLRTSVLWFALCPLPLMVLLGYFWARFGDPLVFAEVQTEVFGRGPGLRHLAQAWHIVVDGSATDRWHVPTDGAATERLVFAVYFAILVALPPLLVAVWRRLGPGYAVYCGASVALAVPSGLWGFGRYVSVLFPLFMALGAWTRGRRRFAVVIAVFAVLAVVCAGLFAHWRHEMT
jgi:hypothetical protein